MAVELPSTILQQVQAHGEQAYPEEGAGFLLGSLDGPVKRIHAILPLANLREDAARHNRYLLSPDDYLRAELDASRRGMEVLGVFHSHPDHPNQPSEFDREWAMPWFSYLITSVLQGQASGSRAWLLAEDRSRFFEEEIRTTI